MFSLFCKWMKLAFLVYLLEAELSKTNGESSKYKIESNDFKISNEGHIANWRIKKLDLEFTLTLLEDEFEVKQTEILREKLKSLGFSGMKVDFQEKIICELCQEYWEFLLFPLIIYQINEENKRKIDKN